MVTSLAGFNASQVKPEFGGAGFFPVSDEKGWLVSIVGDEGMKETNTKEGMFLELVLKGQEGAVAGQEGRLRLNLQHNKPAAVAAAQAQLSALCHVVGVMSPQSTADLMNKPFRVISELQDAKKPDGYTQLANNGIRDAQGNKPGKAGSGGQGGGQSIGGPGGQGGGQGAQGTGQGGNNQGGQGFQNNQGGQGNQGGQNGNGGNGGFNNGGQNDGNNGQNNGGNQQFGNQGNQGNQNGNQGNQGGNNAWGPGQNGNQGNNGGNGGWGPGNGGNQGGGAPGWANNG